MAYDKQLHDATKVKKEKKSRPGGKAGKKRGNTTKSFLKKWDAAQRAKPRINKKAIINNIYIVNGHSQANSQKRATPREKRQRVNPASRGKTEERTARPLRESD